MVLTLLKPMKFFIPISDQNEALMTALDFEIKPFEIGAYKCHLGEENTQNLDNKNVIKGTVTSNNGKTKVPYSSFK